MGKIDKGFYRTLVFLAVPMILQNLITSCLNMADTFMLGQLGEQTIAAVGAANQVFFFFNITVIGITGGCSVFVAQYWGKGDIESINKSIGFMITVCTVFGLLIFSVVQLMPDKILSLFSEDTNVIGMGVSYVRIVSFTYIVYPVSFTLATSLKSVRRAVAPMLVSAFCVLVNIVLNYIFIFGKLGMPVLGIRGAAIATLIARYIEVFVIGFVALNKNSVFKPTLKRLFGYDMSFVKTVFRTAATVTLNDALWALAVIAYTYNFSKLGTDNFAAYQISNTISDMFLMVCVGTSGACAVMVANKIGQGKEDDARVYGKHFIIIGIVLGVISAVILALAAPHIVKLFKLERQTVLTAKNALYALSVIIVLKYFNTLNIIGILRGGGDTKYALIIETISMWCVGVPMTYIGAVVLGLPVYAVFLMMGLEDVAKAIFTIPRLLTGKWVNNLVD